MNETLKVLCERRSVRKYKGEQIKDSELNAILEAGAWAPTGRGLQSPVMVVVQDAETIAFMSKMNAQIMNASMDPFYGAPTVVVVLADPEVPTWVYDGSLVMGNLMNAAYSVGVGSCWINRATEVFDKEEGKALLRKWGIDEKYRGVGKCILGYADGEVPVPKERKAGYIVRV